MIHSFFQMEHLVITTLCNNNCINCINSYENRKAVHPYSFYLENKSKIEKEKHVSIGGGEPTIHPEFFKIISLVNSCGNEYTLLTNGRAFASESFLRKFKLLDLDRRRLRIATALYGHSEEIHDDMTKVKGSFRQTVNGIKSLIRLGFNIELRLIITKKNYEFLSEIAKYILENLSGVERVSFINMKVTGEAYKNRNNLIVSYLESMKESEKAADILLENKIPPLFLHFPFCILPRKFWAYTKGVTIQDNQIVFTERCKDCIEKKNCSGIWKSYHQIKGGDEFDPIMRDKDSVAFAFSFSRDNNFFPVPPLSLASIAGYFKKKGIDVSQVDLEAEIWNFNQINQIEPIFTKQFFDEEIDTKLDVINNQIQRVVQIAELSKYSIVGFSIMGGEYLPSALLIAKYLKENYKTRIIFGGIYTHAFEGYLNEFDFIDKVFVGRAESEMYEYITGKKENNNGSMSHELDFPSKKLYENASEKLFGKDNLFYPYELSQGCVHKCKFCLPRKYSSFSLKDPKDAIRELEEISKKYTRNILFYDCAVNISRANYQVLMEGFKKLNIKYSCYAMPDFSEKEASLLYESGCFNVRLGIESTSEKLLKQLNKPSFNVDKLQETIDNLSRSRIKPLLLFISDIPGQTKEDVDDDINFIIKNKDRIYGVSVSEFSIHYGTDYYEEYKESLINQKKFGVPVDVFVSKNEEIKSKLFNYYISRLKEEGIKIVAPGKCLGFEEFLSC